MDNEEIDIVQALKISWKKKNILLMIMLISLVIGGIYTFLLIEPIYKSNAKIIIDKSDASITEAINSNDIINEIANSFNIEQSVVQENVEVTFDKNTKIITICANSRINNEAYNIVNRYQEILKAKLEEIYEIKTYEIIEQAQISSNPYNINHIKDILIFIIGGIIICGVYCILLILFSNNNVKMYIENSGLILLGEIDKEKKENAKSKTYISKNDKIINQIKKIMANIELNKKMPSPKSILVTGTNSGVGTTYLVTNLATRYLKTGKKVLIINSNIKDNIENKIFNIKDEKGLTDLIYAKNITVDNILGVIKKSEFNNLYILPSGKEDIEEEILISERVNKIIDLLKEEFDVIIIDGEPILKKITAYGWANVVNTVVIIAEYSKTKIEDISNTKKIIENIGGNISGVIINKYE